MPRIRQSFCYGLFADEGRSVEQVLRDAADIGLKAVEIWGRQHAPFDEICEKAGEAGLAVSSMCGHESLEDGLNKRENHNRIEDELLASIEIARTRKISGLICFSGNRNAGQSDNLNLELLNSKVDHPGYQCDHTAWGVEVVKQVNSPNVKLLYDIYHMQIMEGDVIRTIRNNIQHIGHFHTAGNPGRNDMDHTQEMDYIGICRAIASTDYPLFVGHEFITHRSSKMQGLKEAFEICDQG